MKCRLKIYFLKIMTDAYASSLQSAHKKISQLQRIEHDL